jgi:hypothetical protein
VGIWPFDQNLAFDLSPRHSPTTHPVLPALRTRLQCRDLRLDDRSPRGAVTAPEEQGDRRKWGKLQLPVMPLRERRIRVLGARLPCELHERSKVTGRSSGDGGGYVKAAGDPDERLG